MAYPAGLCNTKGWDKVGVRYVYKKREGKSTGREGVFFPRLAQQCIGSTFLHIIVSEPLPIAQWIISETAPEEIGIMTVREKLS
ncbi:unnamed protein product [Lasius platythorax]|uniref:Uncharacterized protein n=1 Tax=Lasius platythorax TaxID=488582 RepID=A0AAV2N5E6_9HYME